MNKYRKKKIVGIIVGIKDEGYNQIVHFYNGMYLFMLYIWDYYST